MASKGHNKRLPDKIKDLKGTLQPCRALDLPKIGNLVQLPKAPEFLKDEGLIYYQQQGNSYLNLGILNEYNIPLFLDICYYIMIKSICARKIVDLMESDDCDERKVASWRRQFDTAQQNCRLSMTEFGLTPASEGKVHKPKEKEQSEFDKFMNG